MAFRGIVTSTTLALLFSSMVSAASTRAAANPVDEAKKHFNFAVQYKNSGNFEEAARQYQKAIALCDTVYQFHFSRGDLLVKMGDPDAARAAFLRALALNPRHTQTIALLAEDYRRTAQYDSALVMYERIYAAEPERRELLASIAGYREYLGRNAEALLALDELIGKGGADYGMLMKAAALAQKEGDPGKARDYTVMALEKKPNDPDALRAAATLSMQLEDRDSAIVYFRRLCEIGAADDAAYVQLENLYRSRGDFQNLLWTLERHLKIAPENVEVLGEYAELIYSQGDIEQGIAYVKKGLAIDPKDGRMHILLGENYRRLNQNDRALAEYKIALCDSAWSSSAQRLIWQLERPETASEKKEKDFFNRKKQ